MAEDKIDSIIDRGKIESELDFLKKNLTEIAAVIKSYPTIKTKVEGAASTKELSLAQNKLAQELKAVESLANQRFATDAKVITLQTDYAKAIAANKVAIQQQNAELKTQAQLQAANTGSIEKAAAQVKILTAERNKLNLYTEEGQKRQAELNAQIDKYNAFIKKNVDALAAQKINVGNYQGSAKIIVDSLEKEISKLKELEKQKAKAIIPSGDALKGATTLGGPSFSVSTTTTGLSNLDAQIEEAKQKIESLTRVTANPNFLNVAGKVGDATAEIKFFTKSLIDLERQGQGNSDAAIALKKHIAELTNQVGGAKAEIKALSSDTRGFDLFAGSVSFAADAFQTFAGAAVLAGASEEDAAEATKTLVAVQSVANGVKGIATELTTRGTAANKVYAYSQGLYATATDASASATVRLAAAGKLLLGVGLIAVLGFIITNFSKLKETFSGVSKEQAALNETFAEASKKGQEVQATVNEVAASFKLAKEGVISKKEALEKYNDSLGDALGKTDDLATAEKNFSDKAVAYVKMTILKTQANLFFAKSAEASNKALLAGSESQVGIIDNLQAGIYQYLGLTAKATLTIAKAQASGVKDAVNEANSDAAKFQELGQGLLSQAGEVAAQYGIVTTKINEVKAKANNKAAEEAKRIEEANLKAQLEILKDNINERIRINKQAADNEDLNIEDRLDAEYKLYQERKLLLKAQLSFDLSNSKLTNEQRKALQNKYKIESNIIEEDRLKERAELLKRFDEKATADLKAKNDAELNLLIDAREKKKAEIEAAYTQEVQALNSRNLSEKDYTTERAKIDEKYRIDALKAEITYTKAVLDIMKLRGVDVSKELQDLAKLERELSDGTVKKITDNEKTKQEKQLETIKKVEDTYNKIASVISSAIEASTTAQKNKIQDEIDGIENRKQKEIEAVNASTDSQSDKANKIAIIEARAAAQKEQQERKQRILDQQKARFDKALSISRITLSTAEAVMSALAMKPPNVPLAIFNGALGAAQLAIAIATPIPRFKDGLNKDYEGPAVVGDGGKSEAIVRRDGKIEITPATDTLTHINRGDRILPDASVIMQSMQYGAMAKVSQPTQQDYTKEMTAILTKELQGVKSAINSKREFQVKPGFNSVMAIHKYGEWFTNYVNEQTNF